MSASTTLAELFNEARRRAHIDLRVALPARILTYYAYRQQADVQPLIKQPFEDEAGERQVEALPVLTSVPVVFPGAGGYRLTFPVRAGDTCLVVFTDSSLDKWLAEGGGPVDPIHDHAHALSDAVAFIGLRHQKNAWQDAPTDRMTIGQDEGPQIHIDGNEIRIGANAVVEGTALGETLQTYLGALTGLVSPAGGDPTTLANFLEYVTLGLRGLGLLSFPRPPAVPTVASTSVKVKP